MNKLRLPGRNERRLTAGRLVIRSLDVTIPCFSVYQDFKFFYVFNYVVKYVVKYGDQLSVPAISVACFPGNLYPKLTRQEGSGKSGTYSNIQDLEID